MTTDLPYNGTSGHSGSDTSEERALREDSDGTTSARQAQAIASLSSRRSSGLTWKELATDRGWHHGQASGVLSTLHKVGRVARLTERRNRCAVYVLPEHVQGRSTAPHGRKKAPEVPRIPLDPFESRILERLDADLKQAEHMEFLNPTELVTVSLYLESLKGLRAIIRKTSGV